MKPAKRPPLPSTFLGHKRHINEPSPTPFISEPTPTVEQSENPIPHLLMNVDDTYDHERLSMRYKATIPSEYPFVGELARYMREHGAKLLSPALPKWWVLSGDDYELSLSIGTENACITLHDFDWAAPLEPAHRTEIDNA